MRDILFRGKRVDNGEWIEGFFVAMDGESLIYAQSDLQFDGSFAEIFGLADDAQETKIVGMEVFQVIPETVGQYTGLKDKNGKRIFEGDVVHILGNQQVEDWKNVNYNASIAFLDGGFCAIDGTIEEHGFRRYALARMDFDLEVIGNIHDNSELLKEE